MRPAPGLAAAACLALARVASAEVSLVVENAKLARSAAAQAGAGVRVATLERGRAADPIARGRFLAELQAAQLIVAVGGEACGWLGKELEGVPVHCVPPFNPAQVLDFARGAGWRRIAAVHTEGYERLAGEIRASARARGLELVPVRVLQRRELPQRLPELAPSLSALWVLGDGLLTSGPGFDYMVELSLSRRVPLIAPATALVSRGAYLGAELELDAVLRHAVRVAAAASAGRAAPPLSEPGRILINDVLGRRWGLGPTGLPR